MSDTNKVLMFDCQLLQTKAWDRGMGKYTSKVISAFLKAEERESTYDEIILLFNKDLKFHDELKEFTNQLPNAKILLLSLNVPEDGDQHTITVAQEDNTKILDKYIEENYKDHTIAFCITSLFLDEACPSFPTNAYKSLIFYDLIPLMYYRLYLGLGASEQYFTRFSILFEADQIFAISETVANDLVKFLGVPKRKVINIKGASNQPAEERIANNPNLDISKPYVLMPTGGDPRKNNLNGVKGFEIFNKQNSNKYQLVITSIFTEQQKAELHKYSDNLLFTDNVTDHELWWLYENAWTVLFPTEYEGLGMPILEAIDADKPIACSDIPVFKEISKKAFFFFDPRDIVSISNSLEEILVANKKEIATKKKYYKEISDYYTWDLTANIVAQRVLKDRSTKSSLIKPRVAIVTPNLCLPSESARFIATQFPILSEKFEIDFFYDMSDQKSELIRPSYLVFSRPVNDLKTFTSEVYNQYDLAVYVIENDKKSAATVQAALSLPGLSVLMDNSIVNVYEYLSSENLISKDRLAIESGDYTASLRNNSLAIASTSEMLKLEDDIVAVELFTLAYPEIKERSFYNRIFVNLDSTRTDDQWNIDYIKEITANVDISRVNFIVATRTKFDEVVFRELTQQPIMLYEELSDHEYNTLLMGADLFVDARPTMAIDKLYPALEALENGLNTAVVGFNNGYVSKYKNLMVTDSLSELTNLTYSWLVGAENYKQKYSDPQDLISLNHLFSKYILNKEL
jgi:glycosyltransferase involved in cell wall biosynthesis